MVEQKEVEGWGESLLASVNWLPRGLLALLFGLELGAGSW